MTQILFVHGGGEGAHDADARLVASLRASLGPDHGVHYPAMPNEGSPSVAAWSSHLLHELAALPDGSVLVGHSLGASIVLKLLAEQAPPKPLGGLFLIAPPFWGAADWEWSEAVLPADARASLSRLAPIFLYHSRDDEIVPFDHLALYAELMPQAILRVVEGRDHQFNEDLSQVAADIRGANGL